MASPKPRKAKSSGKSSAKTSVKSANKPKEKVFSKDDVVMAALSLAADLGWEQVTLRDIAQSARVNLPDLYDHFEDKNDILTALGRMIDRTVLARAGNGDDTVSPRDRLFEIVMERFDVLNDHRAGIVAILSSFRLDPKQAVISLPHLCRSMAWMMEAAGMDTGGLRGAARLAGLTGVYLYAVRAWMEDESADMGKTMAALDKALGRAEQAAGYLAFNNSVKPMAMLHRTT